MKRKIRQKLAVVLSLLVMLGTILGGQVPLVLQAAEGEATIAVSFRDNSASLGKVEIYTGGNWVDYMQAEGDGVIAASNVRIVPNEGYEIDWGGITWREGTETPASVPEANPKLIYIIKASPKPFITWLNVLSFGSSATIFIALRIASLYSSVILLSLSKAFPLSARAKHFLNASEL